MTLNYLPSHFHLLGYCWGKNRSFEMISGEINFHLLFTPICFKMFFSKGNSNMLISVDFQNYCFLSWLYWHGRKHYRILIEITHEPLVLNYCIVIAFWSFWCIICYDKIYFAVDSNCFTLHCEGALKEGLKTAKVHRRTLKYCIKIFQIEILFL